MSTPSTTLDYTAKHPPTDQSEQQKQQHGSQGRFPAPDPTTTSQQPGPSLKQQQQPRSDTRTNDQILDAQSSSPFASKNPIDDDDLTAQGQPKSNFIEASHTSEEVTALAQTLKASLRQYPDFPSPGILFEDILPLFSSPSLHRTLISALQSFISISFPDPNSSKPSLPFDYIVALESRGFLFGPAIALHFNVGFVPVRKPGKLPGKTEKAGYGKEYGQDGFEVQQDALTRQSSGRGRRVLILDDILATGGSAAAASELVNRIGGTVVGYVFLLELEQLGGRKKLEMPVHTLMATKQESKGS